MLATDTPAAETYRAVDWRDGALVLLDQRRLPADEVYLRLSSAGEAAEAITAMVVRGAPAIGIAAAYAVVLAARAAFRETGAAWRERIQPDLQRLREARPTAVNLAWALARMQRRFDAIDGDPETVLAAEARAIHEEDIAANRRMGEIGAAYLQRETTALTHCNAGALATGGYGTALGVIRTAHARGLLKTVYTTETRPWLQGARLTAWELTRDGIPTTLIADAAAAHLMRTRGVDWVIVGADRIAANGDVANKIGTYQLALTAHAHGTKFMVVAPTSTFDLSIAGGNAIPIESRDGEELLNDGNTRRAAADASAWNPVFDITPAALIDVIVTERGAIERPDRAGVADVLKA
ncbi:MAG: S-methyl-5-thioribose-1-phosphate isomerase [Chromatiales bacterium]